MNLIDECVSRWAARYETEWGTTPDVHEVTGMRSVIAATAADVMDVLSADNRLHPTPEDRDPRATEARAQIVPPEPEPEEMSA